MNERSFPDLRQKIAGVVTPDTRVAREAVELAWECSTPMLFNHVMRSYYFGQLLAGRDDAKRDDEVVFLLLNEAKNKPETHIVHPVHMVGHHCCATVPIPDIRPMLEASPFAE